MRKIQISRLFVMCLVFLVMWKGTLQISVETEIRNKRYHESNERNPDNRRNKTMKANSFVSTEPINQETEDKPSNLGVPNKLSTQTYIPQSKIIRVIPITANVNKNNLPKYRPALFYVNNNNELPENHIQNKSTAAVLGNLNDKKSQESNLEVEKIVETEDINLESDHNKNLDETKETTVDVKTLDKDTDDKTEVLKNFTNHNKKEIKNTTSKPLKYPQISKQDNLTKSEIMSKNPVIHKTCKKIKTKLSNPTKAAVSIEAKPTIINEIKNKDTSEEKNNEEQLAKKLISIEDMKPIEVETVPKPSRKHPFLDAIQIDKHLTCNLSEKSQDYFNKSNDDQIDNATEKVETSTYSTGSLNDTTQVKLVQENEKDDNEGVLVRHSKYDEVQEITYAKAPKNMQIDNGHETINVNPYKNYQGQYYNYEETRPNYAGYEYNNNQFYYEPDEQKVEQIDGATVVSYKNYYKMPTPYWFNYNRNDCYPSYFNNYNNNYRDYKRQLSNNYGVYQPTLPLLQDARARIWKSWKNTEYLFKSKQALQQLRNEGILNGLVHPMNSRSIINIPSNNAVPVL